MSSCSLLPTCFTCAHFRGVVPDVGWSCRAFPRGIPTEVLASVKDHRLPIDGDGGLLYEPRKVGHDVAPRIVTDPPVSENQRRALWAAASGHSTLGIPKKVGKEFASADPGGKLPARAKDMAPSKWATLRRLFGEWISEEEAEPEHAQDGSIRPPPFRVITNIASSQGRILDPKNAEDNATWDSWERKGRAASVAFTTSDGRVLLLKRAHDEENWPDTWALPGGKADDGEADEACAKREAIEECGDDCAFDGMSELERTRTPNDFEHVTYVVPVGKAFNPTLSSEHSGFAWYPATDLPDSVHPGVRAAIDRVIGQAAYDSFSESMHPRDANGKFAEAASQISRAMQEKGGGNYGIRVDEKEGPHAQLGVGESIPSSRQWRNGEPTARKLVGSSAVRLKSSDVGHIKDVLSKMGLDPETKAQSYYFGELVHLIHSMEKPSSGADPGEGVFKNASLVGRWNKRYPGQHPIEPRESATDESEEERRCNEGKLSSRERAAANPHVQARANKPKDVFLEPDQEKYPVKVERDGGWKYDHGLLLAAAREARMHGHEDLAKRADAIREKEFPDAAHDMAIDWDAVAKYAVLAYDKSARTFDTDGRLHVDEANICQGKVDEYYGEEINGAMGDEPGWQPLDSKRKYRLYRDPKELAKPETVKSANGIPILGVHAPTDAKDHKFSETVGSTGTTARFDHPFIKNGLNFWPQKAIDDVDDGTKAQLSPGYRYRVNMKPGTTPEGEPFDGRMTDIRFNHLAQVPQGRQGKQVVVPDADPDWRAWATLERAILDMGRAA